MGLRQTCSGITVFVSIFVLFNFLLTSVSSFWTSVVRSRALEPEPEPELGAGAPEPGFFIGAGAGALCEIQAELEPELEPVVLKLAPAPDSFRESLLLLAHFT